MKLIYEDEETGKGTGRKVLFVSTTIINMESINWANA